MKTKCTCACHNSTSGNVMMHVKSCCNNGYIDIPDFKQYVKDGEWFEYNYEDLSCITEQHSELFNGKVEINPDWEVKETQIGKVYVVKPKKEEDGK